MLNGRSFSRPNFVPLAHKHASALACHLRALSWLASVALRSKRLLARCYPILLLGKEDLGVGMQKTTTSAPRPKDENQLETALLILLIYNCKEHQDLQLSMNLINFFIFFKTPPKIKEEDPIKIPFKSLEARMKLDSRLKQKQDTTRYTINKTNRRNSHVARVPASSSVKRAVRYIFGAPVLTNFITVYLYVKKRPFTKAQTQFTCCHTYIKLISAF